MNEVLEGHLLNILIEILFSYTTMRKIIEILCSNFDEFHTLFISIYIKKS